MHHIWARGNARQAIYFDNADRHIYLRLLGQCIERFDWSCLGFCLMTNHMHLLVETRKTNLSQGMHRLHGRYAAGFNRRHRRVGHLFEKRFEAKRMEDEQQMLNTLGYIAANPVDAGLCESADDWLWSSHGAIARGSAPTWLDVPAVHAYLAPLGGDPHARYVELIRNREI